MAGLIWAEVKELWYQGFKEYILDMWNLLDFTTNALYMATITLKFVAYIKVWDTNNVAKNIAIKIINIE